MTSNNQSWQEVNNNLYKIFDFPDFLQALNFVNEVGQIAEQIGHHPEILLTWGRVEIKTTTHDAGNQITDKDWDLVSKIDKLYKKGNQLSVFEV